MSRARSARSRVLYDDNCISMERLELESRAAKSVVGSVPRCQRLWLIRHHDPGALRDRISGQRGWHSVGAISIQVQAAGRRRASRVLRSVSATVRLESVVRVAGAMATKSVGGFDRAAADLWKPG